MYVTKKHPGWWVLLSYVFNADFLNCFICVVVSLRVRLRRLRLTVFSQVFCGIHYSQFLQSMF